MSQDVVKRVLDVALASLALVVLAPLMLCIALWVRLDSPGPALFGHPRVGRGGRPIRVWKFRSMRHQPEARGPSVTSADDARITRAGRILRDTKLDELPQLFNVLFGDMSVVGPRPEVAKYVALYPAEARREILSVAPGITDLASIEFRDEQHVLARSADPERTYEEVILPRKIELYRQYVRERSIALDARIVWRTIRAVVGHGSGRTESR